MNVRILFVCFCCLLSSNLLANGFDNNYEAFIGDLNNDGYQDIYIRQKPQIVILHGDIPTPIVLPPPIAPFVLIQNSDQNFDILSELSTDQIALLKGWPSASIEIITGDFNMDGVRDILLDGVFDTITGTFDQIVFSTIGESTHPSHVSAIDEEFQIFFKELNSTVYNRNYFSENAPTVTEPITVYDHIYLPEWCASPEWVAENGPLENLPPVETLIGDTLEDIYEESNQFLAWCTTTGRTVIHYDFVSVEYQIPAGGQDYSVFNQDAVEASKVLDVIISNGTLEDGSNEKSVLEDILEKVFGTNVFDAEDDIEDPFELLLENITYLAQRKETLSGPITPCPDTPTNINHSIAYARHFGDFISNFDLASKIIVINQNNNITITLNVTVSGTGSKNAIKGINSWSSCRTVPGGATVQFNVQATPVHFDGDISFKPQRGIECRDRAKQGDTVIYPCVGDSDVHQQLSAAHEFGHILGFTDVYTGTNSPIPGFENDIMGVGYQIFPYHLLILSQKYSSN